MANRRLIRRFGWKRKRDPLPDAHAMLRARDSAEGLLDETIKANRPFRRIADIGHDVKNMLTPIQMGMQLLEDKLNDHFKALPASIQDHTPSTQALYKNIIGMTRRGSSRIQMRVKEIADAVKGINSPPRFAACDLGKIVDSVLEALRLNAEERGVVLRTRGIDSLPILRADEQRLFNALYNLINNAIPEVPHGGSVTIGNPLVERE